MKKFLGSGIRDQSKQITTNQKSEEEYSGSLQTKQSSQSKNTKLENQQYTDFNKRFAQSQNKSSQNTLSSLGCQNTTDSQSGSKSTPQHTFSRKKGQNKEEVDKRKEKIQTEESMGLKEAITEIDRNVGQSHYPNTHHCNHTMKLHKNKSVERTNSKNTKNNYKNNENKNIPKNNDKSHAHTRNNTNGKPTLSEQEPDNAHISEHEANHLSGIRRSTSFKNENQVKSNPLGNTYYGERFLLNNNNLSNPTHIQNQNQNQNQNHNTNNNQDSHKVNHVFNSPSIPKSRPVVPNGIPNPNNNHFENYCYRPESRRKNRMCSLHKTTSNWHNSNNNNDYSNFRGRETNFFPSNHISCQNNINIQKIHPNGRNNVLLEKNVSDEFDHPLIHNLPQKNPNEGRSFLPFIDANRKSKLNIDKIANQEDMYIQFLNSNLKSRVFFQTILKSKGDEGFQNQEVASNAQESIQSKGKLSKRERFERIQRSQERGVLNKGLNIDGIHFEISSRGEGSSDSINSSDYYKTKYEKEMNLLLYNFKRDDNDKGSESPKMSRMQYKNDPSHGIFINKTSTHFYKPSHTRDGHPKEKIKKPKTKLSKQTNLENDGQKEEEIEGEEREAEENSEKIVGEKLNLSSNLSHMCQISKEKSNPNHFNSIQNNSTNYSNQKNQSQNPPKLNLNLNQNININTKYKNITQNANNTHIHNHGSQQTKHNKRILNTGTSETKHPRITHEPDQNNPSSPRDLPPNSVKRPCSKDPYHPYHDFKDTNQSIQSLHQNHFNQNQNQNKQFPSPNSFLSYQNNSSHPNVNINNINPNSNSNSSHTVKFNSNMKKKTSVSPHANRNHPSNSSKPNKTFYNQVKQYINHISNKKTAKAPPLTPITNNGNVSDSFSFYYIIVSRKLSHLLHKNENQIRHKGSFEGKTKL
jgi:hypothetical protein